ncbi:MAG: CPBP family intramembrane metalloprotease [Candidatus Krumholzibacteriota bacterium]|nr:CPBP family intramembrane metalloprotease [Candidatus Krumholzibacteriota bacterium]
MKPPNDMEDGARPSPPSDQRSPCGVRQYPRRIRLSPRAAAWIVLPIGLLYALLTARLPDDGPAALLALLPGLLAASVLRAAGFRCRDLYLRPAPLSRTGLGLLAASLVFLPVILVTGRWTGWRWPAALVYAPASGISQELYFRATLLPLLTALLGGRRNAALVVHALLFAAWHLPAALPSAPPAGIAGIVAVTFACGMLWGRQVQRDGTVFWLMAYHSLLLAIVSLYTWT